MKISLRAGEKIYMNGAVFSVDRRVSLRLLNDVTFLLESHVMQAAEATTPLRKIYFAVQTMLMEPDASKAIRMSALHMIETLLSGMQGRSERALLEKVGALLGSGRSFDALREVRELYRMEEANRLTAVAELKESTPCN